MAEKTLNSRIINKHDTEANWIKATNFIPKKGEIIVYDVDSTYSYERFKIGDGTTIVSALPFADDTKVDKVSGKGLSTNDYTTTEKNKLAGIASGANKTVVDSSLSTTSTNPVQNKVVSAAINSLNTLVGDESVSTQISTAIASKADSGHTHDDRYYTESEINSKLSEKSDTDHTHSAYINQNAFSKVVVGSTTIEADNATDTLTLVAGNNVTLTPDASGDKVTIAATNTVYTHPSSGVTAGTYKSVTVNAQGHVTAGSNPTTLSGYGITDAAAKSHSHSNATTSADGFMSSDDKAALDEVINLVGGEEVSSQINSAIATKADKEHTHAIADVSGLQTALDGKETSGAASSALTSAKSYTDTKISELINSAPTTLDTLGEIAIAMEENADVVSALETSIGTKANASDLTTHTSNTSNPHSVTLSQLGVTATASELNKLDGVTATTTELNYVDGVTSNIQTQLNAKVPTSRTVNGKALSANITLSASDVGADASGSASSALASAKAYTDEQIGAMVGDETVADQISTAVSTKADASHTHNYAGSSSAGGAATSANKLNTDAGSATNPVYFANGVPVKTTYTLGKSVPSNAVFTDTVYTHPSYTARTGVPTANQTPAFGGTFSVSQPVSDASGHITAVNSRTITIPSTTATTSAAGLMSATDKTTLDNLDALVGDTSVATQIEDAFDDAITGLSVSGKVITYTKGDGTTGTITTQDTNTTYSAATTSADGLMSATDKAKLNYTNIAYGTCSTAAATAAKVISVSGNTNWTLTAGSMITVLFSATNTASNPTFNVNGTGAKNVYYTSSQITTSSLSYAGYENRPMTFMYDGTQYRFIGWGIDNNSDTKVQQNAAITTAGEYPVILAYSTATSKVTNAVQKTSTLTYNPSTKILTAPTFNGDLTGNADTATSATSATSATKATQDASGNVITSTYATKTELATVSNLVGDTAVATQIDNAIDNTITGLSVSGKTITYTKGDGSTGTITTQDTNTVYTHPTYTSKSAGLYKVTVDGTGHVSAATAVTKSDITALGIPSTNTTYSTMGAATSSAAGTSGLVPAPAAGKQTSFLRGDGTWVVPTNTTYSAATTSAAGLMSAADKTKLDGIATGATKVTVDSALSSSSTNPVQNKVVNTAINNLNTLVGDTAVSTQITNAIASKADKTELPQIATASSSDGVAFTVTVSGITALTAGMSFVMIPERASASTTPTLNVNGLGAKNLRRRLSSGATTVAGYTTTWLTKNKPYRVMYDGSAWVVEGHNKPVAADLYGSVLPKVASATLTAANWTGTESPYSQTVVISGTTSNSKIDLQPTVEQIIELQSAGTALMTGNDSGTITVYAIGTKPTSDYTIQVTITETTT